MHIKTLKCPSCQSSDLYTGTGGIFKYPFRPPGKMFGYNSKAFVCLNCGYLGRCLGKAELNTLKSWLKSRSGDG